jgi:hypothetical protein
MTLKYLTTTPNNQQEKWIASGYRPRNDEQNQQEIVLII